MKKIILKSILLFFPFAMVSIAEVFILPIDFFSFRAWEAVLPFRYQTFDGAFYPNQKVVNWNAGDGDPRGPRTRLIDFYTDKYGYRNRPRIEEPQRYDIVTIGDSLIAGSHLKQHETVAEVLESKCNCNVYNYSGGGTQQLLQIMADPRFMEPNRRPRYVIFESRKGDMYNMKERYPIVTDVPLNTTPKNPSYWTYAWDRYQKHMILHSLQARLRLTKVAPSGPSVQPPIQEVIDNTRKSVQSFHKFFADRGIQFIFFVMPSQDRNFDELLKELDSSGIPTIGHLPKPGLPHGHVPEGYYFKEDSHWIPENAALAAEEMWQKIQAIGAKPDRITRNQ